MKWQDALKILGSGAVALPLVVLVLLNLTGMTYSHPTDINCTTDCYSKIQVNSTYWSIQVQHAGSDQDVIFKKSPASRTLWVNLDKVSSFIPTNPNVSVEILVPATKATSTIKDPVYGYLRPLKDGDYLIQRQNANNPNGDWFIIHGSKEATQTVKWWISLDDYLMKGITLEDPLWIGEAEKKETANTHIFADGTVGWENFSVSFDKGLKASYLGKNVTLKIFVESTTGMRQNLTVASSSLPFKRISNTAYKYNMSLAALAPQLKYVGFYFDATFKPNIKVSDNVVSIGDGDSFQFMFDFGDVPINYTLTDKEFKMDVSGLSNVEIDPTVKFETTYEIDTLALTPLSNHTFVIAFCDETNDDISFIIYDTNGTNITASGASAIDVDASIGACTYKSVDVAAFNSTTFQIVYWDNGADIFYSSVYNLKTLVATSTLKQDSATSNFGSVSVSALNSTHSVVFTQDAYSLDYLGYICSSNSSTLITFTEDATSIVIDSASVDVAAFNSTHFVVLYHSETGTDSTRSSIYFSNGTRFSGPNVIHSFTASTMISVSATALDSTNWIYSGIDDGSDLEYAVFGGNNLSTKVAGIMDIDTSIGTFGTIINSARINSTHYVISFFDDADDDYTYFINGTNGGSLGPTDIDTTSASTTFHNAIGSSMGPVDIEICNDNWVVAYMNNSELMGLKEGIWKSYYPNGTAWDGVCPAVSDSTAPTFSSYSANTTVAGNPANFSVKITDETALSGYIFSTNNTGDWVNYTWTALASGGTAYNITTLNSTVGSVVNVTFYANDSSNNWGIYREDETTTAADTCTYTSGDWNVDCSDNCRITSNVNLLGNDIYFSGAGRFEVLANIIGVKNYFLSSGCVITIGSGKIFGGG